MSTFEFCTTVPLLPDNERLRAIARGVTDVLIERNRLNHGDVVLSHVAVFNGSGDLKWINFEAAVYDVDHAAAKLVQEALGNFDLSVSISEQMPDDFDSLGMFTTRGAELLKGMLEETEVKLRDGSLSPVKLREWVEDFRKGLADAGHGEVYDTAVREVIWERLDRVLENLGIQLLEV